MHSIVIKFRYIPCKYCNQNSTHRVGLKRKLERFVNAIESPPPSQLNRAKALNNEIIANRRLIDDAKQAAANLLASLDEGQMSPQERRQIEDSVRDIQDR